MQESMPETTVHQPMKKQNGQINFPNLETRLEKLERKRKRREMEYKSTGDKLVMANLSKNHPDYGMSPQEHLRAKAERLL